jgi:hypothetical protein
MGAKKGQKQLARVPRCSGPNRSVLRHSAPQKRRGRGRKKRPCRVDQTNGTIFLQAGHSARMKFKSVATIAVVVLAMGAAPPFEAGGRRSAWSGFVEGVKQFAHNPFGLARRGKRQKTQSPNDAAPGRQTSQAPTAQRPLPRPNGGVRQTTALLPEPKAAPGAGGQTPHAKRATLYSRPKRRARTISEYMAEEKP